MSGFNTWPKGYGHAMTQKEHGRWNSTHYPGTRQICCKCDEPTTFCEEDGYFDEEGNPYCEECAEKFNIT